MGPHAPPLGRSRRACRAWPVALALLVWLAAVDARAATPAGERAAPPAPSRGLLQRLVPGLTAARRDLSGAVLERTRVLAATRRPEALASVILLAAALGALLAAGPGHGKVVIAAFFAGRGARPARAVAVASAIALLQVAVAIAAVWILGAAAGGDRSTVLRGARWIEFASYALVILAGLRLAAAVGRPAPRRFGAADWGVVLATGLTPSAGTILLLLAVGAGAPGAGAIAALAMAPGIAAVLSAVALGGAGLRAAILRGAAAGGRRGRWVAALLAVAGAVSICAAGTAFAWAAWPLR